MVEQLTLNQLVLGSSPSRGTTSVEGNAGSSGYRTDSVQNPAESETRKLKFPKVIRHRKIEARIYGKSRGYLFYRLPSAQAGATTGNHELTRITVGVIAAEDDSQLCLPGNGEPVQR